MSKKTGESPKKVDFEPRNEVFPSPGDWRDQFVYHLMVDRFTNGDEKTPAYEPGLGQDFREVDHV